MQWIKTGMYFSVAYIFMIIYAKLSSDEVI